MESYRTRCKTAPSAGQKSRRTLFVQSCPQSFCLPRDNPNYRWWFHDTQMLDACLGMLLLTLCEACTFVGTSVWWFGVGTVPVNKSSSHDGSFFLGFFSFLSHLLLPPSLSLSLLSLSRHLINTIFSMPTWTSLTLDAAWSSRTKTQISISTKSYAHRKDDVIARGADWYRKYL
ncbi:hypothetical protein LX36DRAFT_349326 [Colletotrichum falcatum]|nr:hypothetical protein LX36DRAFT_349326 [Colletotrichum falcatum]